jgi:hypothetical protein
MIVIKLGGNLVSDAMLDIVAGDVAGLASEGARVILVHGGGAQTSAMQQQLGQTPTKIGGRRVTDSATLEVIKMVVGGRLNIDLCSALLRAGAQPIGLHGASACVIEAVKRRRRSFSAVRPSLWISVSSATSSRWIKSSSICCSMPGTRRYSHVSARVAAARPSTSTPTWSQIASLSLGLLSHPAAPHFACRGLRRLSPLATKGVCSGYPRQAPSTVRGMAVSR